MALIKCSELESARKSLAECEHLDFAHVDPSKRLKMLERWKGKRAQWARMNVLLGWLGIYPYREWVEVCDKFIRLLSLQTVPPNRTA